MDRQLLPLSDYYTAALAPAEQFTAWRRGHAALFDFFPLDGIVPASFAAQARTYAVGNLALPQAIGAQLAFPDRQVVTFSGDGGLSMLLGDLLTLHQLRLPVKIVVFANGALGFVELEMKAAGVVTYGTELENPDFSKIAEASGILGIRVEDPAELRAALSRALQFPGPALIEVVTARQELSMPPTITREQAAGFSLWAIRTVMSGRGDELIDLARTNLWR